MIDCDCTICAHSKKHPQLNAPRCWHVTAENITDEQIRGLLRSRALHRNPLIRRTIVGVAVGDGATYTINGVQMTQADARARCAEILNARQEAK